MDYLCTGWGAVIKGSASTLGDEYYFNYNEILCGGFGALTLSLCIDFCVGVSGVVTDVISTLRCSWVVFRSCSAILVCVSFVSGLIFGVISLIIRMKFF